MPTGPLESYRNLSRRISRLYSEVEEACKRGDKKYARHRIKNAYKDLKTHRGLFEKGVKMPHEKNLKTLEREIKKAERLVSKDNR